VGDECIIGGIVDVSTAAIRYDVSVDVLDQFGLGIRRTGDQYCAGGTDRTDHVLKEGVILGSVLAADRVRIVMNVSSGMLRLHHDLVNIRPVRQGVLRDGNSQAKPIWQRYGDSILTGRWRQTDGVSVDVTIRLAKLAQDRCSMSCTAGSMAP
jgi:hypothetical protein